MQNYYEILGVSSNATFNEIREAHWVLYEKFHPSKNEKIKQFDDLFSSINEAFSVLSNSQDRKNYDLKLQKEKEEQQELKKAADNYLIHAVAIFLIRKEITASVIKGRLKLSSIATTQIIDKLKALKIIDTKSDSDTMLTIVDKEAAIQILSKQIDEFSLSIFMEIYNQWKIQFDSIMVVPKNNIEVSIVQPTITVNRLVKQQKDYTTYSVPASPWDEIRDLKMVRNGLRILAFCLFFGIIIKFLFYRHHAQYLEQTNDGASINKTIGKIKSTIGLNIRSDANSTSSIVGAVGYNEMVSILDKSGPSETISGQTANWIKIDYNGIQGWVWGGFVEQ